MTAEKIKDVLDKHAAWLKDNNAGIKADLIGADLIGADLSGADLSGANLSGANLDYSSGFSFRCGSFGVKIDVRIAAQMAYHFCRMVCDDQEVKDAQKSLAPLANKFHRLYECGKIEVTA